MTLYSVLVAEQPLPTIDCRGIEELTVKEMKLLYPAATDQVWYSLPDETLLIHVADESAFGQLHIFEWTDPPTDLADYHQKPYVYGIEGNWHAAFLNDLLVYMKKSIEPAHHAELIRYWVEDGAKLKKRTLSINTLELHHLEKLATEHAVRVVFTDGAEHHEKK